MVRLLLVCYLVIINVITFVVFVIDKIRARGRQTRVPESTLLSLAVAGGGVGALLAMWTVRHKTRHSKFTIGVPAIMLAQVAIVLWWMAEPY